MTTLQTLPPAGADHQVPRGARGGHRTRGLIAAVLLVAMTAVTLGFLAVRAGQSEDAQRGGLQAARTYAKDILSYDYRHLEQDFAAAKAHLTGEFATEYGTTTAKVVAPTAKVIKAVVEADVVGASVISEKPGRVLVLLFVNQTTRSGRIDGFKVDQTRVRMTLIKVDGQWRVSGIDAI